MIKLMSLELKRNNIRTYITASIVSCFTLIAFIYFVAYVAQVENQIQFQNYENIFRFTGTVSMIIFSIMSAVMCSRFIIGEYTGKRASLLFSYPVSRGKILLAKLLLIFVFISMSMLICTSIPYILFSVTESISPIVVQDTMSANLIIDTLQVMSFSVLAVGSIGIVSMRIGFINKSIPATLIVTFLLSATYGNASVNSSNIFYGLIISGIGIIATVIVMIELSNRIKGMEVE